MKTPAKIAQSTYGNVVIPRSADNWVPVLLQPLL